MFATKYILASVAVATVGLGLAGQQSEPLPQSRDNILSASTLSSVNPEEPLPPFIEKALAWLVLAQYENGGWGSGSHARQDVRDPHNVPVDPATTAFSAQALIRTGTTLQQGKYRDNLQKALDYLLDIVEAAPENGNQITNLSGTQPQAKLGNNIDVSMTSQFLARVLPLTIHDRQLTARVERALDKLLRKLEGAQHGDGSWNDAGWAPVLQSAMANTALEMAAVSGRDVDQSVLDRSRGYQEKNIDTESRSVRTDAAAGISLYSVASGQRAAAPRAKEAMKRLEDAKASGKLGQDAELSKDNLLRAGIAEDEADELHKAYRQYEVTMSMMQDESVLSGFGNNGGEEFLSYMMTSEALAVTGGDKWQDWSSNMNDRLRKIQNPDGSWSGHHCITSPVFSTAAVIMTVTADRDEDLLQNID